MNPDKEKRERWIFLSLAGSFIIYALYHTSALFEEFSLPIPITLTISAVGLILFCLSVFWSLKIGKEEGGIFPPESQKWIVLLVLSFLLMSATGLYLNNPIALFYNDFEGVVILFGSILLGARRKNWEHIDKLFIVLLFYAIVVNTVSLPLIKSFAREDTEHSVTNKLQVLLYPVLFYIYLYKYRVRKLDKIIIISAFVLFIIEQILFQKRLPSLRIIITLLIMVYIQNIRTNPSFWSYLGNVARRALLIFIPVAIAVVVISTVIDLKIADSLRLFNERITGKYGFVHNIVYDTRLYIASVVIENIFSNYNYVVGRGFGGYILDPRLYWIVDTGEGQFNGTSQIEIGHTWPVWKGGLLFWISINALFISLVVSFRKYRNSYFNLACWAFILIHFIFLLGENIWTGPWQFYLIVLGASIGHLLGRSSEKEFNMGGRLAL